MTQKIDQSSSLSNAMETDSETDVMNETQMDDLSPHSQRRRLDLTEAFGIISNVDRKKEIHLEDSAHECPLVSKLYDVN